MWSPIESTGFIGALTRRKTLTAVMGESSELGKVLTTYDLIALGVGCTLGVGVYVLPGVVSKDVAGPGVILSFFYAAFASVLAGLCYAEFGAKVPKAGSAYIYSYVTVGEFVAFIIGWNLIIEYIIGGASVARGVSLYLDSMFGNAMADYFRKLFPMNYTFLATYPDFFALVLSVLVCIALAVGLKESVTLNNLLTAINCAVVVFVIIVGGMYADFGNWTIPKAKVPQDYGDGGFLPYGLVGTLRGAATCFYGFVGFDVIATSGEEVVNPQKAIPLSIIVSLLIVFVAYSGVSSVLTLMWPYFLQDVNAPIPFVFAELDMAWAQWIVTIGGIFGLGASLFGGMFPLPRVIYAMSQDGLLFQFLGKVHPKYKTPFVGTILSGFVVGIMAAVFSLKNLVDLMSLATLVCYTIVAMSVLIIRYRIEDTGISDDETSPLLFFRQDSSKRWYNPTNLPITNVSLMVYILTFLCGFLAVSVIQIQDLSTLPGSDNSVWLIATSLLTCVIVFILSWFCAMPSDTSTSFKMPGVPFTPTLSIFFNLYLMLLMDLHTWILFAILMVAGFLIYFGYGLRHSKENMILKTDYNQIHESESYP